jgi:hypothetical protein
LNTHSNLLEKNLNFWKETLTNVEIAFAQELNPKNRLRLFLTMAAVTKAMVWDEKVESNIQKSHLMSMSPILRLLLR